LGSPTSQAPPRRTAGASRRLALDAPQYDLGDDGEARVIGSEQVVPREEALHVIADYDASGKLLGYQYSRRSSAVTASGRAPQI
jgi:hypothetical protein